jgi:lysophospholipase L1-like esterase
MSGGQTVMVSPAGDYTARAFTSVADPSASYHAFLSAVDVERRVKGPVIVAFGDSITDGYRSTDNANRRWPDRLTERLEARSKGRPIAVVNAGIGGNRVLSDGFIAIFGKSALARFDRDVLAVPGASHLIILEGVNDLGGPSPPSADDLIAGYRQLIARARDHGIKVYGATILPYEGAAYFKPQGEVVRQAVNQWIRTGGAFDGVIDFDALMRDPAHPSRMIAGLQSGDWLHPNDAGYRAMGDAVDLSLFR